MHDLVVMFTILQIYTFTYCNVTILCRVHIYTFFFTFARFFHAMCCIHVHSTLAGIFAMWLGLPVWEAAAFRVVEL